MIKHFENYKNQEYFMYKYAAVGSQVRTSPKITKASVANSSRLSRISRLFVWSCYLLIVLFLILFFIMLGVSLVVNSSIVGLLFFLPALFWLAIFYNNAPVVLFLIEIQSESGRKKYQEGQL